MPISQIQEFLQFLTIPFINLNFIDITIIVVMVVYIIEGYALGFIRAGIDFISFLLSFIFALTFYDIFGKFLVNVLHIPKGFGNALGFFLAAVIFEIIITLVFRYAIIPFVSSRGKKIHYSKEIEKAGGIIPGLLSAVVLLSFVLTMLVALPLSPFLKNSVSESRLGEPLVSNIQGFDKQINNVFGGAVDDALTFLTVEPKSQELLKLNFNTENVSIDSKAQNEMLDLINQERNKTKLKQLVFDVPLTETGQKHCTDMFARGFFSHYTPEGKSPFDRMAENDITFKFAGENLALAPNAKLAMKGLMNSAGHKANILSKDYAKVGIGVIDGGIYGEMFCQEFTD